MEDKTLLITIKPQHLCNILNGIKTIEIRKNKNLANAVKKIMAENGECRIKCVCSKSNEFDLNNDNKKWFCLNKKSYFYSPENLNADYYNGKVVCEIVVDSVDDIVMGFCPRTRNMPIEDQEDELQTIDFEEKELCKKACLTKDELHDYFNSVFEKSNNWWNEIFGYALHIKSVIPYEKPKELKEFYKAGYHDALHESWNEIESSKYFGKELIENIRSDYRMTTAPQNFCYVEEE